MWFNVTIFMYVRDATLPFDHECDECDECGEHDEIALHTYWAVDRSAVDRLAVHDRVVHDKSAIDARFHEIIHYRLGFLMFLF